MTRPILYTGDTVAIVAPSLSLSLISEDVQSIANERLTCLGLNLTFSKNAHHVQQAGSASTEERVHDLHAAFADPSCKALVAVIGGSNANQLLPHLDWDLIKHNPKPLIGYSDTTALQNAIFARTGGVSYSGPAYSTFGQRDHFDYTLNSFKSTCMSDDSVVISDAPEWTDDEWYVNQDDRHPQKNQGSQILNQGEAEGVVVGGNLSTLALLFGTRYMPSLEGSIVFLEDDEECSASTFERLFESLMQQQGADSIAGIVIGRFQGASGINVQELQTIVAHRTRHLNIPVVANLDFGHTSPIFTFPVGGAATLRAVSDRVHLSF